MQFSQLTCPLSLLLIALLHGASSQGAQQSTERPSTLSTTIIVATVPSTKRVTQNRQPTSIPTQPSVRSTTKPTMKTMSPGTTPASTTTTTLDPGKIPVTKFSPKPTAPPSTIITTKSTTPSKVATVDTSGEVTPSSSSCGGVRASWAALALLLLLALCSRL